MQREKIVSEMFSRGHLLTEEAVKILEESELPEGKLPLVVDVRDIQKPYKILKNVTEVRTEMTKDDFVKYYNSKYEKMKAIITGRLQKSFVSLNRIDSTRIEIHAIGIVRDVREKDGKKVLELEDTTASVPVIFDSTEDAELDDVIAVRAIAGGRVLYGKKILYPDIPLRQPATGSGKGCFISDLRLDEAPTAEAEKLFAWLSKQNIPYIFIAGNIGDPAQLERYIDRYCYAKTAFVISEGELPTAPANYASSRIVSLSNPAMVEVGGLKILMAQKADAKLLKKRHLGGRAVTEEDQLALEEVPDVVHSGHSREPYISNYKSVTLVNSGSMLGEFRPVVVDFATRDAEKVTIG